MSREDRSATRIEEPVLESAPLARRVAPELCQPDPTTGENCSWYHGFWQYLRALGLITTPEHHAAFFREAFGVVAAGTTSPRILVSGAADYSILAHVLWACRQHGAQPSVVVLDACETPLYLNRWYADRVGCDVSTHRADILEFQEPEAFDAVCAHSFFGRFLPHQRTSLVGAWRRVLKPGGVAIAVNRVRSGQGADRVGFSPEQARAFRDNVVNKALAMPRRLDVDPPELGRQAEAYAARHRVYPVHSEDEIRAFFEGAGMSIERLTHTAVSKAVEGAVGGPTTLEGAGYACVIGRKT
jgi:SAM-dependent methyltransferase